MRLLPKQKGQRCAWRCPLVFSQFWGSDLPEAKGAPANRQSQRPPKRFAHQAEPGEEDEAASETGEKQSVTAGGGEAKRAFALSSAGVLDLQHNQQANCGEQADEDCGRGPGPCHPA